MVGRLAGLKEAFNVAFDRALRKGTLLVLTWPSAAESVKDARNWL